jgi:hypothetical protein
MAEEFWEGAGVLSSDLTMPGSSTWGNLAPNGANDRVRERSAADASASASFKSFGGLDSETEFMDYTDDVTLGL